MFPEMFSALYFCIHGCSFGTILTFYCDSALVLTSNGHTTFKSCIIAFGLAAAILIGSLVSAYILMDKDRVRKTKR